jgi:oligopeptidase B
MRPLILLAAGALLAPAVRAQDMAPSAAVPKPPAAARQPHSTSIHGRTLSDDYFWIREKTNPAVREYLEAENAYTDAMMKPYDGVRQQIYDEMLKRIKQTDQSVPYRDGDYVYYSRTEEGKQYPIYCRKRLGSDAEEVLLDQNALAAGHAFYALGALDVSDDGNLLAYSFDTTGYRQYVLRVKDLRTGQLLADDVRRVVSVVWAADNRTIFLTTEDSVTKRNDKFWRHPIGGSELTLLYTEPDDLFDVYAYRSDDEKTIFLGSYAKTMSEARYIPADRPMDSLRIVLPREKDHEYSVNADGGKLYILTKKGAKNFKLVSAPFSSPKTWTTVVAHNPKVKLDGVNFFRNWMVLSERENGLPYIRVVNKATKGSHRIATPEPAFAMWLGPNPEYDRDTLRFVYNSMVTPQSTFDYAMRARARKLLKQQDVFGYDAAQYESKRIWATSRDGTKVPVSLVYRRGTKLDGSAPMLLYAYGSYGVNIDPTFNSHRISLLDRGFIYALASIRGGGELGEEWREAGRMFKKMNTFTDFVDVADHLVKNRYTSSDRLMIQGASAGGLLMGAVLNMKPDLFKAAIVGVPFVDVMNTMLDASIPLTTSEWIEWGNPNNKADFDYMIQYSPYDNIKPQAYPAMLVEVGLNDSQVPYWEGTKYVAKLRQTKTDTNVLLLKANMGAGHGGASGRYDRYKEIAFEYAFLISQLPKEAGLTP